MPSNKDRLYVALYARGGASVMPGGEDTYHWALILGPKKELDGSQGSRYHTKERSLPGGKSEWYFEEMKCSLFPTSMLLVRVIVGKVADRQRVVEILRKTPLRGGTPGWNCVGWVKEALESLEADGRALGRNAAEWEKVRGEVMGYCQRKKDQHRFDGKGLYDGRKVPTFDLMEGKEVTS